MKKILLFIAMLVSVSTEALANPACVVCTVAIGASLSIARKIGVDDNVVAVWLGSILALLGYWSILWFNKKNWHFWGRDYLLIILSLFMVGGVYIKDLVYSPEVIGWIFYMDQFLFSALIGAIIYILSQKIYEFIKIRNNGRAHFPFEKVVIPLVLLVLASVYLTYFPLCQ